MYKDLHRWGGSFFEYHSTGTADDYHELAILSLLYDFQPETGRMLGWFLFAKVVWLHRVFSL